MPGHDIIVVGASAGGVDALVRLVSGLPEDLPASLFVVLHVPAEATSQLPGILTRSGALPATHPRDCDEIRQGHIYIAPPDRHLLVERDRVRLAHGPKENRHRPAVDPLFRSAAAAYGARVVGVILTGSLDDGTAGLQAIKTCGGTAVAQDPGEALYASMPRSAINNTHVDHVLPLAEIPTLLQRLAHEQVIEQFGDGARSRIEIEAKMADMETNNLENLQKLGGKPSVFSCPECHGILWETRDGELLRFRCQVGHAYTADSMLADQSEALERALWAALRALEERSELMRRLAERTSKHNHRHASERFAQNVREAEQHATVIKGILEAGNYQEQSEDTGA